MFIEQALIRLAVTRMVSLNAVAEMLHEMIFEARIVNSGMGHVYHTIRRGTAGVLAMAYALHRS